MDGTSMRLRFLLHPLSVLVVFALAVTSCATSDATNADSAGPPSAPEVEEVAGSSTAVEDDPGDTTTLAELLAVSDGSESQTMFWRSLHIEGALFDAVPSIGELSKRSSIVVVGEVLSYVDGRTYESLEENTVDVAPPLLSFRLVEVEVRVDQIVAGELAPGTEAARLKLDIWRPADAPKVESEVPATGSKVILFLVSQRASDINREELQSHPLPGQGDRRRKRREVPRRHR